MLSPLRNRAGKRLREPFGKAGLTVGVIALVFAMLGGAYAASNDGGGGKATASAKAKKGPRGPKGPKGDPGPAGPQGLAGPAGPQGPKGDKGDAGDAGAKGATGTKGATGAKGTAGSKGTTGQKGATGFSGFTETLPSGKTETGTWAFGGLKSEPFTWEVPISFAIPLSAPLVATGCAEETPAPGTCQVHYLAANGMEIILGGTEITSTACLGTAQAPSATPGNLCMYTQKLTGVPVGEISDSSIKKGGGPGGGGGATPAGAFLTIPAPAENAIGTGTWAVTAP